MTVVVLLCMAGGILLPMFPKTGIAVLLISSGFLAAKSSNEAAKKTASEDVQNSTYVSGESSEYTSSSWYPRAS